MIELTKEAELLNAQRELAKKLAQSSVRYTNQELSKVKLSLSEDFKLAVGHNKESFDVIAQILDQADLNEDGSLDITKFHHDLVARVAVNEGNVVVNTTETARLFGLLDVEVQARIAQGNTFSQAINIVKTSVSDLTVRFNKLVESIATEKEVQAVKTLAQNDYAKETRALAVSNQDAIKAFGSGLITLFNDIDAEFGFTPISSVAPAGLIG
jgi:hypothetical protein